MLKTDKWETFMETPVSLQPVIEKRVHVVTKNDGQQEKPRTLTAEERRALIYAPFPPVTIASNPHGHSQAPAWVATATQQNEEGW